MIKYRYSNLVLGGAIMGYIAGKNRGQVTIFPETIDEYISENNPVRVVDAFIENLDLEKAAFTKSAPSKEGRSAYNSKDLSKLYIYSCFNKIRSSRKLKKWNNTKRSPIG